MMKNLSRSDFYYPALNIQKIFVMEKSLLGAVANFGCSQQPDNVVPPNLEYVLVKLKASCNFGTHEVKEFEGADDFEKWISEKLRAIPEYQDWNKGESGNWIDLSALERNVTMQLAQETVLLLADCGNGEVA